MSHRHVNKGMTMTRIIIDEALRKKLHNFSEPLELCDESGRSLARVVPVVDLTQYEAWEPPINEEEMRRREQSNKWYSTEQVIAHLKDPEKP
jgi:hypothetical protein